MMGRALSEFMTYKNSLKPKEKIVNEEKENV